jgi:CRISPR-associated protein Cmr4
MTQHLITLYTRTPLHVGSGTSVDVVDLPLMRERITNFPVIPSTSLKGVLRQAGRDCAGTNGFSLTTNDVLFGNKDDIQKDDKGKDKFHAGCLQIMEAKLLAFPVRSLAGCFAWLTCPAILHRFQRDTGRELRIPDIQRDQASVGNQSESVIRDQGKVVLEEYAITAVEDQKHAAIASLLTGLTDDPLWKEKIAKRLVILHDEDFQHFATTCTEVVARIVIDPKTRTNSNLFNQENIPCETLFYSVITVLAARREGGEGKPEEHLKTLLDANKHLQIGGDETTGHGFCEVKSIQLPLNA